MLENYIKIFIIIFSLFYGISILYYITKNLKNLTYSKIYLSWIELILYILGISIYSIYIFFDYAQNIQNSIKLQIIIDNILLIVVVQFQILTFLKCIFLIFARNKIFRKPTRNTFLKINSFFLHLFFIFIILGISTFLYFNFEREFEIYFLIIGLILPLMNVFFLNYLMKSLDKKYNNSKFTTNHNKIINNNKNIFIHKKENFLEQLKIKNYNIENNKPSSHLKEHSFDREVSVKNQKENILKTPLLEENINEIKLNNEENFNKLIDNEQNKFEIIKENLHNNFNNFFKENIIIQKDNDKNILHPDFNVVNNDEINKKIKEEENLKLLKLKNNVDFINNMHFEDINDDFIKENLKFYQDNPKNILKEKFLVILIFCEFLSNKIFVDYILFLLISVRLIINLIFEEKVNSKLGNIIKYPEEINNNTFFILFNDFIFIIFVIFSSNLYTKFDEIIFNNKTDSAIKFIFFTKYNIFPINFFVNLIQIKQGFERYSNLSNSNPSDSNTRNSYNSNECYIKFENNKTYSTKFTLTDEKFINCHLIINLYFKILKTFFEKNEKYFLKQEKLINNQILINNPNINILDRISLTIFSNINNTNLNTNISNNGGNKDLLSIINTISESSVSSFGNIKTKINLYFKKFLNKIQDFEVRNLIEKKLRNDVLTNTTVDENFIINKNISDI